MRKKIIETSTVTTRGYEVQWPSELKDIKPVMEFEISAVGHRIVVWKDCERENRVRATYVAEIYNKNGQRFRHPIHANTLTELKRHITEQAREFDIKSRKRTHEERDHGFVD